MAIEGIPILQNLLSILASALSIGNDLKSSTANHPSNNPDVQREIDDYISSARKTLVEVNALLAANVFVLTDAEFYLHADRSEIIGQELSDIQGQRLKDIDTDSRSDKVQDLLKESLIKKAKSERLHVAVSHVSAIAQKRAQGRRMLTELTVVCDQDPTFQRRLDFLSLSKEIISISKTLDAIGRTFEELASPYHREPELSPSEQPIEIDYESSSNELEPKSPAAVGGPVKVKVQSREIGESVTGPLMKLRPFSMS